MDRNQLNHVKKCVRQLYQLDRDITDEEARAEVANLTRKKGDFGNLSLRLCSMLVTGDHPLSRDTFKYR